MTDHSGSETMSDSNTHTATGYRMDVRDPVTVLLPTVRWTTACDQVAAQLRADDELFVICDREDDPVAGRDPPDGVEILVAGDPEGCAAKANALAYGMERATNDRFVWSDADYERDDDWLDCLVEAGEGTRDGGRPPHVSRRWVVAAGRTGSGPVTRTPGRSPPGRRRAQLSVGH